jgi:hypothetical protein
VARHAGLAAIEAVAEVSRAFRADFPVANATNDTRSLQAYSGHRNIQHRRGLGRCGGPILTRGEPEKDARETLGIKDEGIENDNDGRMLDRK